MPLPSSILIAFSATLFGVLLTSVSFSDLFTGTGTSPFTYVLRRYTGQLLEAQVLTVPKGAVEEGDAGKIGPRPVIIPANTAVLLIAADQRARVRGPGMYVSRPFEHVAKVFSLRPIKRNFRFRDVLTDDNTPLAIEVDITYGIDVREDGRLWARGLSQRDRANLRHIVASTPDWETALRDVVDRNLRNAVGTCDLGDILDPGQQRNVSARTARTVRTDTQGWGVRVYDFELICRTTRYERDRSKRAELAPECHKRHAAAQGVRPRRSMGDGFSAHCARLSGSESDRRTGRNYQSRTCQAPLRTGFS